MNMNAQQKFMTMFNDILSERNGTGELKKILQTSAQGDEVDKLNKLKEETLKLRLDQRNILFLRKVEQAKQKILDGTYGHCEDCGENISQKRLMARPTAFLCIDCQEEKERDEFNNFKKRRDLAHNKFTEADADSHISEQKKFKKVSDISFESVVDM